MTTLELLHELHSIGIELRLIDGRIRAFPARAIPPELRPAVMNRLDDLKTVLGVRDTPKKPICPKCGLTLAGSGCYHCSSGEELAAHPEWREPYRTPPECEDRYKQLSEKQRACRHTNRTPTVVGGSTCDDCGLYSFEKRPKNLERPLRSYVNGHLCEWNHEIGKWIPVS